MKFLNAYDASAYFFLLISILKISEESPLIDRKTVELGQHCLGLNAIGRTFAKLFLNMKPDTAELLDTKYYFVTRKCRDRVQVYLGDPDHARLLEWVNFKPDKRTIVIVPGFLNTGNDAWVNNMASAFLDIGDVNVIMVDWSGGANTWKYWRAVANVRTVGSDLSGFLRQLINMTGAEPKNFHFIGHSLGAHICAYAGYDLGNVSRITGLDPAQPCFVTNDNSLRLDQLDADFVDVIHTNGRLWSDVGLGLPDPVGHADFYPNGGMVQPGCYDNRLLEIILPFIPNVLKAMCSHGRAYQLFTESLRNIDDNCIFIGRPWDLTYGVNISFEESSWAHMGIKSDGSYDYGLPRANGTYFVLTNANEPFCITDWSHAFIQVKLLSDLKKKRLHKTNGV